MLGRQESQRADLRTLLKRLRTQSLEYGRLVLILAKLYCQSRVLILQNYILRCRLRMWDAVFVYFKIQIFLIRLAHGFPLAECWPTEKPVPPLA